MKKVIILLFLFIGSALANPAPMSLDWERKYATFDTPKGYRYYMGSIDWGMLIYVGTEDILSMESELQIFFNKRGKIHKTILILGPQGIDEENCLKRYRKVINSLNVKYGNFQHKIIERDPVISELIYASSCYPVRLGMMFLKHMWKIKNFIVKSSLLGDADGTYIEIEYISRNNSPPSPVKEILKKL
jgi:hypothetical protein